MIIWAFFVIFALWIFSLESLALFTGATGVFD